MAATAAVLRGDRGGYERELASVGLVEGAGKGTLAGVGQVLAVLLDRAMAKAWAGGWQPADLDRLIRRKLGAKHAAALVSAIVHEHRRYAAVTISRPWRAQLDAIGAFPWERSEPAPEGTLAFPGSTSPPDDEAKSVADLCRQVEVLAWLCVLPVLPRLGPLPGEARGAGSDPADANGEGRGAGSGTVDARVLERVRALLAKAESTTFAEEAEVFTAKAQELMARHALDQAMLDGAGRSGGPGGRRIGTDDPYAQAKSLLLDAVATANRCRTVWSGTLGFSTVFGHEGDLDGVELLYTSLLVQATRAVASAGSQVDRWGRSSTRSFRTSFYVAYAHRIGQRLAESTAAAEAAGAEAHGAGLLPVLAARNEAVDEAFEAAYPDTKEYSISVSNGAGWAAGTSAADQARLNPSPEVERRRASA